LKRTLFLSLLFAGLSTALSSGTAQAQSQVCGALGSANVLQVVLLTADQQAFCYIERTPFARPMGPVVGLMGGETLVGIDYRPANGVLYGLGSGGGIYTLTEMNGQVNAALQATANVMGVPVALTGTSFGVDFNPVPDLLRVVSDTGQNLRINVVSGATTVDTALSAMGVTAAAYTNNDGNPGTLTVLNVLNSTADQISIQAPPNNGTQNPLGALTVDASPNSSFDIFTLVQNGVTVRNRALALLTVGAAMNLYEVNLETGAVTLLPIPGATGFALPLIGIAIPLTQSGTN
jgi:hypothetical protein